MFKNKNKNVIKRSTIKTEKGELNSSKTSIKYYKLLLFIDLNNWRAFKKKDLRVPSNKSLGSEATY